MGIARKLLLGPLALALFALVLLGGCQRRPTALTPVTGKVAFRGLQLHGGLIVFTPDPRRGESGPSAFGKIREDGSFTLLTGEAEGASAGWYRVTVGSLVSAPATAGTTWGPPQSSLPDKYRDPELSLLGCEVKPDRANQLDFNLD